MYTARSTRMGGQTTGVPKGGVDSAGSGHDGVGFLRGFDGDCAMMTLCIDFYNQKGPREPGVAVKYAGYWRKRNEEADADSYKKYSCMSGRF